MIAMLLLAGAVRCADPSFCPTSDELRQAIRMKINLAAAEIAVAENTAHPDQFTSVSPRRILRVSDIYCDEPIDDAPRTVNCKVTVHFSRGRSFQIVRLVRDAGGWKVEEGLAVRQER